MHNASLGHKGWPKKSKLTVEEGEAVGSTTKDSFSKADNSHGDVVNDVLGGFDFDIDGNEEHKS